MKVAKDEFVKNAQIKYGQYHLNVDSDIFGKNLLIVVSSVETSVSEDVTEQVVDVVNSIDEVGAELLEDLNDKIFQHYISCVENSSYNAVPEEIRKKHPNSEADANREYFSIFTKNDALKSVSLDYICVDRFMLDGDNHFFGMYYKVPWEEERGVIFGVTDGVITSVE